MTPEELAHYRAIAEAPDDWAEPDITDAIRSLCDALEKAWAERCDCGRSHYCEAEMGVERTDRV